MRERVTFLEHPQAALFDPKKHLRVTQSSLHVEKLEGAREDRLTFQVEELPQEILLALRQCQQLHIRWARRDVTYAAIAPFNVRLSPGLHVFFTPQGDVVPSLLCPALIKVFGKQLSCESAVTSFTLMPKLSDRFAPSTAFNYYSPLSSLDDLGMYLVHKVCPSQGSACLKRASALAAADYLDADWNSAQLTLTLTAYRGSPTDGLTWDEMFDPVNTSRLEVGILGREQPVPADPENLALTGHLTVIGKDKKPDAVMFTFPSRHHDSSTKYSISFVPPTGLHPTMRLSIAHGTFPTGRYCKLYAHLTLPSVLFPDKYQLSAPLFLQSNNLRDVRAVWGETDLEAPGWAVTRWGSSMLLELLPPTDAEKKSWDADVPLHLRYLTPAAGGMETVEIPWPALFWACRAHAEANLTTNPFDRNMLGYDGLFAAHTLFYHLQPNTTESALHATINVPVLAVDRSGYVESATTMMILAGLGWVLWKLLPTLRPVHMSQSPAISKEAKRK